MKVSGLVSCAGRKIDDCTLLRGRWQVGLVAVVGEDRRRVVGPGDLRVEEADDLPFGEEGLGGGGVLEAKGAQDQAWGVEGGGGDLHERPVSDY